MKLLLADSFSAWLIDTLTEAGHVCIVEPDASADDFPLDGVDGLIVRSTAVDASAIERAGSLRLIIRAGAGTNTIDVEAAVARGIQVSNVPGRNAIAVAELVMGLILSIDRNIPDGVAELRAGRWDKKRFSAATGVAGRRLGIVGLGNVGLALAERANAFAMVVAVEGKDRSPATRARIAELGIEETADRASLLGKSDVVSVHIPSSGDVVVDEEFLAEMRDGAILINTSRGEIVDEQALIAALDTRGMRAGLDVFRDEPAAHRGEFSSKLAQHPSVYGTHHIGASTAQAQRAVASEVVAIVSDFDEGKPRNEVSP